MSDILTVRNVVLMYVEDGFEFDIHRGFKISLLLRLLAISNWNLETETPAVGQTPGQVSLAFLPFGIAPETLKFMLLTAQHQRDMKANKALMIHREQIQSTSANSELKM
jgi:hypothetical protein